ncbi:MAG TPA: hypothetical protein PKN62_03030 [bacterium]|nr:hypothetical protein [bacterium]
MTTNFFKLDGIPDRPERPKSCPPLYQVKIPLNQWSAVRDRFQADYGLDLPDEGEFSLGSERNDIDVSLYSDHEFQGKIVKTDGQVEVLFDEAAYSNDGEWYFAETFLDSGCEIEKID